MKIAHRSARTVTVAVVVSLFMTLVSGNAIAASGVASSPAEVEGGSRGGASAGIHPLQRQLSETDEQNYRIALRYVHYSDNVLEFDRAAAIAAGADESWTNEFAEAFARYSPMVAAKQQNFGPGQSWDCIIAVAGLTGATAAAIAAIFASGGTLAFALAQYGISGISVVRGCY